jgi:hypothetical protein
VRIFPLIYNNPREFIERVVPDRMTDTVSMWYPRFAAAGICDSRNSGLGALAQSAELR